MSELRLNKYLAEQGIASRREADKLISAGHIKVNGKVVTEMGIKIDPNKDKVEVDEKQVRESKKLVYIALNKPKDYVCSVKPTQADPRIVAPARRKTVLASMLVAFVLCSLLVTSAKILRTG